LQVHPTVDAVQSVFAKVFDVRSGEFSRVSLLWLQSLLIGFAIVSYESAATSLFLSVFEVSSLPLVYIGVAVVSVIFGIVYMRLEEKLTPARLFPIAVTVILAGMLGARGLLAVTESKWAYLATMVWLDVTIVFLGLQFWSLAGLLLNVRQSKRLFGIIGSGEVLGVVIGGLLVPVLVRMIGTVNVFLWAAGCLGVAFLILLITVASNRSRLQEGEEDEDEEELTFGAMLKTPYLLLLFAFSFFVVLSDYFVDFFFYAKVDEQFPSEEKLASFLGPFFAAVGAFSFFAKLFLFNRIMKRFGVLGGLLTMPIAVLVAVLLAMSANYYFPDSSIFGYSWVFVFILLTKMFDLGLRPAISEPTTIVLFQPIAPGRRVRVQSFNDSVIEPINNGLTGVILLVLTMGLGWGIVEIGWTTAAIFAAGIIVCFVVRRGYATELTKTFEKRNLTDAGASGPIDERTLRPYLKSDEPGEVIYGLFRDFRGNYLTERDLTLRRKT
jgi:AAA family ATP:ADP antiporter